MKLNEKIRFLREQSGYTQEQIANQLQIGQSMLSKMENDERNISLDILYKISDLCLCTLQSLLDENMAPEITKVPFRKKGATQGDLSNIMKANKIILNLKEMVLLENEHEN